MGLKNYDDRLNNKYTDKADKQWGRTSEYDESYENLNNYTEDEWDDIQTQLDEIMYTFASYSNYDPASSLVQTQIKKWQRFLTKYYYECTNEILHFLGHMYVEDERFKTNIDKYGKGTADFMCKAIDVYCKK